MQRYNLRPRPVTKPKFYRLLDVERFPQLAIQLRMIENDDLRHARLLAALGDECLFVPPNYDPDYQPSEDNSEASEASDHESCSVSDALSVASSTDLFGLEVVPTEAWHLHKQGISLPLLKPPSLPATTPHRRRRRDKREVKRCEKRRLTTTKHKKSKKHEVNKPQSPSSTSSSSPQDTPSGTISPEPHYGRDSDQGT